MRGSPQLGVDMSGSENSSAKRAAKAGISFGSALAIAISWSTHKSIIWAILHGLCTWVYVVYYALTRGAS